MKTPKKEQVMYAQLFIADATIDYIANNLENSLFEDEYVKSIISSIQERVAALQMEMERCFEENEVRRVCY